jgi:dGTP triphosphohydrolase
MSQALRLPQHFDDRSRLEQRKRLRPSDTLVRAATAELCRQQIRTNEYEPIEDALQRQYGGCLATGAYLQRTATAPAMTTVATWAAELVAQSMPDFLATQMPASAFAQLAARALTVTLDAENRGQWIVEQIFKELVDNDGYLLMPEDWRTLIEKQSDDTDWKYRTVGDYIAGMTDSYCIEFYERILGRTAPSIQKQH